MPIVVYPGATLIASKEREFFKDDEGNQGIDDRQAGCYQ